MMKRILCAALISLAAVSSASAQIATPQKASPTKLTYDHVKVNGDHVVVMRKSDGSRYEVEESRTLYFRMADEEVCSKKIQISVQDDSDYLTMEGDCTLSIPFKGREFRVSGQVKMELDPDSGEILSLTESPNILENGEWLFPTKESMSTLVRIVFADFVRNYLDIVK